MEMKVRYMNSLNSVRYSSKGKNKTANISVLVNFKHIHTAKLLIKEPIQVKSG